MPCPCSPFCPYRRKLRADISAAFPSLSEEDLNELIPNKEELNIKLTGGAGQHLDGILHSLVVTSGYLSYCCLSIISNKALVAIGTAAVSSSEMSNSGSEGERSEYFTHIHGPAMVNIFSTSHKLSSIGGREMEGEECEEEEQEVQDSPDSAPLETSCQSMQELRLDEHKLLKEEELVEVKEEENIEGEDGDSRSPQGEMSLTSCHMSILTFIVFVMKVPRYQEIHWSQCFFLPFQLSKFLQCMQKDHSLIQVKEVKNICCIFFFFLNNLHSFFRLCSFSIPEDFEPEKDYVNINPTLCDCLLEKSEYKEVEKLKSLADLFSRTFIRMQACHEVLFPGQPPVVKKGQMEPIDITVASRAPIKECDPAMVRQYSRSNVPYSPVLHDCLYLYRYQIPWKYVQGLDKGTKPGKKKWQTKPQHKSHMLL
uniref:Uncharacterized protein n=1 Tax=Cyprinus carpio TaxID=7962 RepID=A0A8C2GS22_CYPCA